MHLKTKILAAWFVSVLSVMGYADEPSFALPEDGSWARFDVTSSFRMAGDGDVQPEPAGTLTVRMVGKVQSDGKPYRWIEFETLDQQKSEPVTEVFKLLIALEAFSNGGYPLKSVLKAWEKNSPPPFNNPEVQELTWVESQENAGGLRFMPILHGPFTFTQPLGTKPIETKAGTFKCSGFTASETVETDGVTHIAKYEIYQSKQVPFDVVVWKIAQIEEIDGKFDNELVVTMTLREFGLNAKSAIPDQE